MKSYAVVEETGRKENIVTERKFIGQNDNDIIFKVLKFCVVTGLGIL